MSYDPGDPDTYPTMRIKVANLTSKATQLVIEPLGDIVHLAPNEARTVVFTGDTTLGFEIDVSEDEIKIWQETRYGYLAFAEREC